MKELTQEEMLEVNGGRRDREPGERESEGERHRREREEENQHNHERHNYWDKWKGGWGA